MSDECCQCGEGLGWYEREIHQTFLYRDEWPVTCHDCERANAMREAIADNRDELVAVAEVEREQRDAIRRVDDRERGLGW